MVSPALKNQFNFNPHVHVLAADGAFLAEWRFVALPAVSDGVRKPVISRSLEVIPTGEGEPHWPAPVSVAVFSMPARVVEGLRHGGIWLAAPEGETPSR